MEKSEAGDVRLKKGAKGIVNTSQLLLLALVDCRP